MENPSNTSCWRRSFFIKVIILFLIPLNFSLSFQPARGKNWSNRQSTTHQRMCFSAFLPNIKDALIFCAGSLTAASIFHICEGGKIGSYKGQTQKEILGISPDKATVNALENLSKWEFMQLFYASPSVDYGAKDIAGEWSAKILPIGLVHPITTQITKRFMGDGEWVGKGLFWDRSCYNIFSKKTETNRMLNFNCKMGKSFYDGGDTLVFDYSQGNTFPLNGMKDEVRVVNHNLLIGLGSLALFGGQLNSAAFALIRHPEN